MLYNYLRLSCREFSCIFINIFSNKFQQSQQFCNTANNYKKKYTENSLFYINWHIIFHFYKKMLTLSIYSIILT